MVNNTKKISIVIPCYNCTDTLREAVDSCFTQGLENFEIVMVDDGSKDGTRTLMEQLKDEHPALIRLIFHDKNKGGGAARNTGIKGATGELIYCLDSDNFFAPNTLSKLADYLIEKSTDGVAFHERRFFDKDKAEEYTPQYNTVLDRPIVLADLFTTPNVLLDNFLFTKESFLRTKGFPEHHGFDTQGFEIRYLSIKNTVCICPNTAFYHRQLGKDQSYFEREYNAGNFSVNYYLAIEDIFDLLSNKAQGTVIDYDIFKNTSLKENIFATLKHLHSKGQLFRKADEVQTAGLSAFSKSLKLFRAGDFNASAAELEICKKEGFSGKVLYYNILRSSRGVSGTDPRLIEKETAFMIKGMQTEPKALYKIYHRNEFLSACVAFIKKWIKK